MSGYQQQDTDDVNSCNITGIVKEGAKNISQDGTKAWWGFKVVMTKIGHTGQPFYQTLDVLSFNPNVSELVSHLKTGDKVFIQGSIQVKRKKVGNTFETSVNLANGLNQQIVLLSSGHPLPQPQQQGAQQRNNNNGGNQGGYGQRNQSYNGNQSHNGNPQQNQGRQQYQNNQNFHNDELPY